MSTFSVSVVNVTAVFDPVAVAVPDANVAVTFNDVAVANVVAVYPVNVPLANVGDNVIALSA